ncbi:MAG: glycosidase [Bacteroidales bacterium]|nr:glycosidase [Bacteroidales bacterium]
MKKHLSGSIYLFFLLILIGPGCTPRHPSQDLSWTLGPFVKDHSDNPVLGPLHGVTFPDPVRQKPVAWEAKDVFNPASIVCGDTVFMLYRAEDSIGKYNGTSRIGLAYSLDGIRFTRYEKPVLYPARDPYFKYEWEGGCEDPRIVEDDAGTYYMTYTAYNGDKARLFIATSGDLRNWKKYGSVFRQAGDEYVDMWSKSGAIVCRLENGRLIATRIHGKYWMYWGESNIYMATSDDLIHWTPLLETDPAKMKTDTMRHYTRAFKILISPRQGMFDSELVESGPPAILTDKGILFIYNSKNSPTHGDPQLAAGTYAAGQVLTDKHDPTKVLSRTDKWFIAPDQPFEMTGQVNNVCFVEGLSFFHNKWFLYYGTADSKIAVAVYSPGNTR